MTVRIIPRLDIKGPNLVKGIHLEGLRVLGRPEAFARHYYATGADELIYMDVVASLYGRNSLLPIVERIARDVFIPITVGGGIRTIEDVRSVLRSGADKVAVNTAAIARPEFITEIASTFGASTVVVSIEAIKHPDGRYEAYTDNGRESTGVEVIEWAARAAQLGAGEILITSVDFEGTGRGFDIELNRSVAKEVSIPVIAAGGAGETGHILEVINDAAVDGVGLASILHYGCATQLATSDPDDPAEGNLEHLRSGTGYSPVTPVGVEQIRESLNAQEITNRRPHDVHVN